MFNTVMKAHDEIGDAERLEQRMMELDERADGADRQTRREAQAFLQDVADRANHNFDHVIDSIDSAADAVECIRGYAEHEDCLEAISDAVDAVEHAKGEAESAEVIIDRGRSKKLAKWMQKARTFEDLQRLTQELVNRLKTAIGDRDHAIEMKEQIERQRDQLQTRLQSIPFPTEVDP